MNFQKVFSKNIYEMIDSFMKTKPIFQPLHFRDFMNPNNIMYNPPLQEIESIAIGGEGSPMCEANLDAKLMYMMFNVSGKLISNLATPTTIGQYNMVTPIVINSLTTPTILLSQNASDIIRSSTKPYYTFTCATIKGTKF